MEKSVSLEIEQISQEEIWKFQYFNKNLEKSEILIKFYAIKMNMILVSPGMKNFI